MQVKPSDVDNSIFLNYMIKSEGVSEQLLLDAFGTSQQFISLGYIRKVKTLIPTDFLVKKYSGVVPKELSKNINDRFIHLLALQKG